MIERIRNLIRRALIRRSLKGSSLSEDIPRESQIGPATSYAEVREPSFMATPLVGGSLLLWEGTEFELFNQEDPFFDSCSRTGQGSLRVPFSRFWATCGRGFDRNIIGGGMRLLCGGCITEMPFSFMRGLREGYSAYGLVIVIGDGAAEGVVENARSGQCPWCGSSGGILLWDRAPLGDVTPEDLKALRGLWRQRCRLWWPQQREGSARCGCSRDIPRDQGFHTGSQLLCELCVEERTSIDILNTSALRLNRPVQTYFGISEIRRARNFAGGTWSFERGKIV